MAKRTTQALFITPAFWPTRGGLEQHLELLLPELAKSWQIQVLVRPSADQNKDLSSSKAPFLATTPQTIKVQKLTFIPKVRLLRLLLIWLQFLWHWRDFANADLIWVQDIFPELFPLRLLFPKKIWLCTFHGWETQFPLPKKNLFWKQLSLELSDQVIAIGEYISTFYHLPKEKITVSYGALPKQILLNKKIDEQIRKKHSAEKTPPTWLFVGRLAKDTGLAIFLAAFQQFRKEFPQAKIQFCGGGPLQAEAEKFGQVFGWVDQPQAFLQKADFACAGGYLAALEAMQIGVPVLAVGQHALKTAYWQNSPFAKHIIFAQNAEELAKSAITTWQEIQKDSKEQEQKLAAARRWAEGQSAAALASLYQKTYQKALLSRQGNH
jgi:glycosyltransferase involved in cell wall biosynthesis